MAVDVTIYLQTSLSFTAIGDFKQCTIFLDIKQQFTYFAIHVGLHKLWFVMNRDYMIHVYARRISKGQLYKYEMNGYNFTTLLFINKLSPKYISHCWWDLLLQSITSTRDFIKPDSFKSRDKCCLPLQVTYCEMGWYMIICYTVFMSFVMMCHLYTKERYYFLNVAMSKCPNASLTIFT